MWVELINSIFEKGQIPDQLNGTRLIFLNKSIDEAPTLNQTRPIAIAGLVTKVIEALTLQSLV